ncbi:MAG: hypothetical protein AAGD06_21035 [Acidobacteriota bacterium]
MRSVATRKLFYSTLLFAVLLSFAATAQAQPYVSTVVVSPVIGSPAASGTALLNAIAGITGANANNPYLLKLEPGIYDIGTTPFQMKPYVDVEGSGRTVTVIRGLGQEPATFNRGIGIVMGASPAEMRQLTVRCNSNATNSLCISIANVNTSPRFVDMTVTATDDFASHWGFRNTASSPYIDNVDVVVTQGEQNYGIVNAGFTSRPTIVGSRIVANHGSFTNDGILNREDSAPVLVEDVDIKVRGGSGTNTGMQTQQPQYSTNYTTLRRVSILADGAATQYGILRSNGILTVLHSQIVTYGANGNGVLMEQNPVTITHSEVVGSAIRVVGPTINIGTSWLRGSGSVDGFISEKCAAVYENNFNFFANTCP